MAQAVFEARLLTKETSGSLALEWDRYDGLLALLEELVYFLLIELAATWPDFPLLTSDLL